MSLIPISRDELRTMQVRNEEEQRKQEERKQEIQTCIEEIYNCVILQANDTLHTIFKYNICKFNIKEIYDIIDKLKVLFPECNVVCTTEVYKSNGTKFDCDLSKIDDMQKKLLNKLAIKSTIVIDWT